MNKSERRARRRPLGHSIRTRLTLMSSLVIGLIALATSILYPIWHEKQVTRTLIAKAYSIVETRTQNSASTRTQKSATLG